MIRLFIHLLVIAGLVLSTVSPACAFIAGPEGGIQICGADGRVKTIEVSGEFNPALLLTGAEKPLPAQSKLSRECPFCVAFSSLQADAPGIVSIIPAPLPADVAPSGPGSTLFVSAPALGFSPTGPPRFLFM